MQKAALAAEQPAKKRKLLSKKAATAPALAQQRAPVDQGAAACSGAAEAPEAQRRNPAKGRKAATGTTQAHQSEPCQTPQAGAPQVTRRYPTPEGLSLLCCSQSQYKAHVMPIAGDLRQAPKHLDLCCVLSSWT